jgi:hypothetical protein
VETGCPELTVGVCEYFAELLILFAQSADAFVGEHEPLA